MKIEQKKTDQSTHDYWSYGLSRERERTILRLVITHATSKFMV